MCISHQKKDDKAVSKKRNIMEINGRRYDAHSGTPLDHGRQTVSQAAKPKTIAVHHASPAPAAVHQPRPRAARKAAQHAPHHQPQRSTTLMRRVVKRPPASLKRHVKAQSHTGALVENPVAPLIHSPLLGELDSKRLHRAERIKRSRLIMHFNPRQPDYQSSFKVPVTVNHPAKQSSPLPKQPKSVPRQQAPDIDEIFDRAIQNATSHLEPSPKKAKKRRLHLTRKHVRA